MDKSCVGDALLLLEVAKTKHQAQAPRRARKLIACGALEDVAVDHTSFPHANVSHKQDID